MKGKHLTDLICKKEMKLCILLCSYAYFQAESNDSVVRHLPSSINRKQELPTRSLAFLLLFFDRSFSSFHCHNKILKEIKNTALEVENISPVLRCQDNCILTEDG